MKKARNATSAERTKATRLRRLRSAGTIGGPDRAWLDAYESERAARKSIGVAPASTSGFDPDGGGIDTRAPNPQHEKLVPIFVDPEVRPPHDGDDEHEDDGYDEREHDDDDDGDDDDGRPSKPQCPIEHDPAFPNGCPACRGFKGGKICGPTGRRVFPPMDDDGAEGFASFILTLIGAAVKFFRDDRRFIPPTAEEKRRFARALKKIAARREWAMWMGAIDDLVGAARSIGGYGARALNEPSRPRLPRKTATTTKTDDTTTWGPPRESAPDA